MQVNRPNPGHRADIRADPDRTRKRETISLPGGSVQIYHPEVRQTAIPNYSPGGMIWQAGMD